MKLAKETDADVSISEYQKYWLDRFLLHIASGLSWSGPTVWLKTNLCWSHLEMPGAPSLVRTCKCSFFLWNVTSGYTFSTARLGASPSACVLQKKFVILWWVLSALQAPQLATNTAAFANRWKKPGCGVQWASELNHPATHAPWK